MSRDDAGRANSTEGRLDGRLPVLCNERIYRTFWSFLWTCTAFSAATWAFVIGSNLPTVGHTLSGILGYACGMTIGFVLVVLSSGLPSYRYGIDTIDASKAAFGINGVILPLLGALATMMGWGYVLVALTARGAERLITATRGGHESNTSLGSLVAIVMLFIVWLATRRGPLLFQRLSQFVAPGQMLVTTVILGLLFYRYGWSVLWNSDIPPDHVLTQDRLRGFAYAVEFGVSNALAFWPVLGGLTRLVQHRKHLMAPSLIGSGLLGAAFLSGVAAIAAARSGTSDPTVWLLQLGGPVLGTTMLGFLLTANVITAVILFYLAAVTVQQVQVLARVPWGTLLAILLLPGLYVAFHVSTVLDAVMKWLSYNGLMFVGVTGITLIDYFVLRRQRIEVDQLFTRSRSGAYWYCAGINWGAIAIVLASIALYLHLYDPSSYHTAPAFRYLGASIPTVILSAVSYYILFQVLLRHTIKTRQSSRIYGLPARDEI